MHFVKESFEKISLSLCVFIKLGHYVVHEGTMRLEVTLMHCFPNFVLHLSEAEVHVACQTFLILHVCRHELSHRIHWLAVFWQVLELNSLIR